MGIVLRNLYSSRNDNFYCLNGKTLNHFDQQQKIEKNTDYLSTFSLFFSSVSITYLHYAICMYTTNSVHVPGVPKKHNPYRISKSHNLSKNQYFWTLQKTKARFFWCLKHSKISIFDRVMGLWSSIFLLFWDTRYIDPIAYIQAIYQTWF